MGLMAIYAMRDLLMGIPRRSALTSTASAGSSMQS